MAISELHAELRSWLELTTRVVQRTGNEINVGERFTVRFTVTNRAPRRTSPEVPDVAFEELQIGIGRTAYAAPVNGPGWHPLPVKQLEPAESASVEVEFEAIGTLNFFSDWLNDELIARPMISANVDYKRLFNIRKVEAVHVEIDGR